MRCVAQRWSEYAALMKASVRTETLQYQLQQFWDCGMGFAQKLFLRADVSADGDASAA